MIIRVVWPVHGLEEDNNITTSLYRESDALGGAVCDVFEVGNY